jgi:hypothetical protein
MTRAYQPNRSGLMRTRAAGLHFFNDPDGLPLEFYET